jgi:hypothetical protein
MRYTEPGIAGHTASAMTLHNSKTNHGHICLYSTLLIGHKEHRGQMRLSSWPLQQKLQQTNRQDMVFIQPPGISYGAFQLGMDNIWFCKLLLHYRIYSKTDARMPMLLSWTTSKVAVKFGINQVIFCRFANTLPLHLLCMF